MIITKHILIFYLKNPASVKDDFWSVFIAMISVLYSFLINANALFMPIKHSIFYYACADLNPDLDEHLV